MGAWVDALAQSTAAVVVQTSDPDDIQRAAAAKATVVRT